MDFSFTDDQEMFRDTARKFFANECPMSAVREILKDEKGYSADLWKKIAELGWLSLLIDEEYGGLGVSFMELFPILEEMGRAMFPSPFFPTVMMGSPILSENADGRTKSRLLPSIVSGDTIITLGVSETGEEWSEEAIKTRADKNGEGYILKGTKMFVPFAGASDYIICCARDNTLADNGISLFLIDTKSAMIECTPIPSFSIDKYYKVGFDGVEVPGECIIGSPGKGWEAIQSLWPKIVTARCMEMIGGQQKVLEMTVQFVKEREQFGKPIGSLQTIQNYCAEMAIDVETSKYIAYQTAWKVSNDLHHKEDVSIAKVWCGDAYQRVTAIALQSHGAMGFTEEYDLHFFYKQAKSLQLMHGGSRYHREVVAQEMGL